MTILDTNVVSELIAVSPAEIVVRWMSSRRLLDDLLITVVTIAEILYGVELLPKSKRRDRLHQQAEAMFAEDFTGRILPFDEQAARAFAPITAIRRTRGRPIAEFDAQIAAIARVHGATVATRNTSDFEGCGVRLINPWEG
jgi:toxin FitB